MKIFDRAVVLANIAAQLMAARIGREGDQLVSEPAAAVALAEQILDAAMTRVQQNPAKYS